MNIVALLAAGSGSRTGLEMPKQFVEINGKPLIANALETFQNHNSIDSVIVVANPEYFDIVDEIKCRFAFTKIDKIVEGGAERYLSSYNAVRVCTEDSDNLLIHDAARPNLSSRIIDDLLKCLEVCNAATVAVPATDTVYVTDNDRTRVISVSDRRLLMNAQTPQAFKVGTIRAAFAKALADTAFTPTDDASIVLRYLPDEIVRIVPGDSGNFKITYKSDFGKI
ncbi:MAG: 2-C-methyl-D-erythritol 4-phosphate cytidylyltransferase [Bacteroidales bacterium]|nr:2-C-methyl-D-erythritol 4-phosphate cytidylyltransferase [Bacteroidales bacterium]